MRCTAFALLIACSRAPAPAHAPGDTCSPALRAFATDSGGELAGIRFEPGIATSHDEIVGCQPVMTDDHCLAFARATAVATADTIERIELVREEDAALYEIAIEDDKVVTIWRYRTIEQSWAAVNRLRRNAEPLGISVRSGGPVAVRGPYRDVQIRIARPGPFERVGTIAFPRGVPAAIHELARRHGIELRSTTGVVVRATCRG